MLPSPIPIRRCFRGRLGVAWQGGHNLDDAAASGCCFERGGPDGAWKTLPFAARLPAALPALASASGSPCPLKELRESPGLASIS